MPSLTGAVGIALGAGHGCAWSKDGAAFCWGENSAGQLGDGSSTRRTEATPVIDTGDAPLLGRVTSMALGQKHSCALLVDETVRCWGDDTQGQAGGAPRLRSRYAPVVIAGLGGVKAIAAGNYTTCALLADGTIRCWGGALSGGTGTPVPTAVEGIGNATQISVGFGGACARIADGGIRCWNMDGPKRRVTNAKSVVVGWSFGCLIGDDGIVKCWGSSDHGRLGDGTAVSRPDPTPVRW